MMDQMQGQNCLLRDVSPLILLSLQTFQVEGGPSTCKPAKELGSGQEDRTRVCDSSYPGTRREAVLAAPINLLFTP